MSTANCCENCALIVAVPVSRRRSEVTNSRKRITVTVTQNEKRQIAARARFAGISVSEFMRRAAFTSCARDQEWALEAVTDQIIKSTLRACDAIDRSMAFVEKVKCEDGSCTNREKRA